MKKFYLSHSKILNTLGDDSDEAQAGRDAHLDEIEHRMKRHGARVVDRTRYNVAVEMNEAKPKRKKWGDVDNDGDRDFDDLRAAVGVGKPDRKPDRKKFGDVDDDGDVDFDDLIAAPGAALHVLFDIVLDTAEDFFGFVEAKANDLKDWIDHIEAEHDERWHPEGS